MFFLSSVNLQIFEEKIPNKESWLLLELDDGKLFFKPNESIQNCVAYVRNWYFRPNPKFSAKLFFFSANSLCLRLAHIIFQMLSHSSLFEILRSKQVVRLDKAPRLNISIVIWILSSISQLNQFNTNSEAAMLSRLDKYRKSATIQIHTPERTMPKLC